ncbi:MAG: hypothetical protein JOZ29_05565 [Deltaproteobacteria bacterium]|nr:hypothetical protein [Deltaproteobacteria bacterium]MBV8451726.1 hypothetical protein [Deltaproteobacteria bacterium]
MRRLTAGAAGSAVKAWSLTTGDSGTGFAAGMRAELPDGSELMALWLTVAAEDRLGGFAVLAGDAAG